MKTKFIFTKSSLIIILFFCFGINFTGQDLLPMINSGNQYLSEGEYNLAIDQFDMALNIEEYFPNALIGKAKSLLGLKNHNAAIDELKKAINNNDSVPEAFLELGKIHYSFGNYSAANRAFEAGVEESDGHASLHYYLGSSLYKLEHYNDSEKKLLLALQYGDSSAYLFYYLCELNLMKDSLTEAMTNVDLAIERNANIPRFHLAKGDVSFAMEDYLWSSLHYSTALRLNPDYLDARVARAHAYLADEKHVLALADLRKIVEEEPDLPQAWADKATCEFALEKYEDAIDSYGQAFNLEEDYSWISKRAIAYQLLGEFKSAINDLHFLVLQFPDDSKLRFRLGNVYQLDSQYENALEEYKKCIELDRNDVLAWNNKAVVLYHLGKKEHACHIWNEIIGKSFDEDFKDMAKHNIVNYCREE